MGTALNGIFHNGVAGMLGFSQAMGAISDNIANQSTIGYKRVDTLFSTVLGLTERTGSHSDSLAATLQARNTAGVRPVNRQLVDVQGAIQTTGRPFDLAISGGGMFFFANPIFDAAGEVSFDDVLYSRAGDLSELLPTTLVDDVLTTSTTAFLANKNGQLLLAQPITAAEITPAGITAVALTDPLGYVPVEVSSQDPFEGLPTTTAALAAVIPASGATTVSTPIFYVDANGDQQGLTVQFSNPVVVAGTSTTWDLAFLDSSGAVVQTLPAAVEFDSEGQLPDGTTVTVTAGTSTFDLDISNVAMLGDSTSGTTAQAVQVAYTHDGLQSGAFEGLEIRNTGVIYGRYTGGATQPLYIIPIAAFANPNALESVAGNMYRVTAGSGEPGCRFFDDDFASLEVNAVETSNVDLADAFSQMIVIQKAYSSAAKIVQTADEMNGVVRDLMR